MLNAFRDFLPDISAVEVAFSAVRKKNAPYVGTTAMREAFDYANPRHGHDDAHVLLDRFHEYLTFTFFLERLIFLWRQRAR